MPALEDMRALTQEIIQAHRNRVEATSELKGGVASMLAGFESARQAASKSQRTELARAEAANKAAVAGILTGFQASRKSMSSELRSGLSRDNAHRQTAVDATLAGLGRSRHAMAIPLHKGLAQDAAGRSAAMRSTIAGFEKGRQALARGLREDLSRGHIESKNAVGTMLGGFHTTQRAVSRALRTELAQTDASRKSAVRIILKEFLDEQAQVRREHMAVRDEWQKLVTTMRTPDREASGPSERHVPAPSAAPVSVHKTAEPATDENPELAVLRNRVFKHLADRPDGTRLVEIEETMGVSRFQMSRVLRSLMDENMVEKRDLLYFAV